MVRISRNVTFNETEMATSINIRSFPQEIITLTTSTDTTEIIENIPNASDTDIADTNDANITLENIKNAPFENITVEPAPVRRSTRHRKAIFKTIETNAVEANAMGANTIKAAETPTTSANEEESEKENYLPKAIIAKSITANENKPTYEEIIINSEKSQ
jgi:hypothetical protein